MQRQSDEEKQKDFKEIQIFCQALASIISKSTLGSVWCYWKQIPDMAISGTQFGFWAQKPHPLATKAFWGAASHKKGGLEGG